VIQGYGLYPMPIGSTGVAMIDARDIADIADIAVAELLRRDRAPAPLPCVTLELVGPELLTGASVANIWSAALGREVTYGGDDVAAFEGQMASLAPSWLAYDMRLMMAGIQKFGMHGADGAADRLQAMLGRPLRKYADSSRMPLPDRRLRMTFSSRLASTSDLDSVAAVVQRLLPVARRSTDWQLRSGRPPRRVVRRGAARVRRFPSSQGRGGPV
jgi:hypothetical protein